VSYTEISSNVYTTEFSYPIKTCNKAGKYIFHDISVSNLGYKESSVWPNNIEV
jgi:hypothetical protein